jgi:hypothetical protein
MQAMQMNEPRGSAGTTRTDVVLRLLHGEDLVVVATDIGRAPEDLLAWKDLFVRGGRAALDAEGRARGVAGAADAGSADDEPAFDWGWEGEQLGWMVTRLSELFAQQQTVRWR